jgi:tRNA threonylcarbamoyladenosine biosynthesis protein TsaB
MLLAIDTSTHTIGMALYDGVQVLGEIAWVNQDYHTAQLAPAVNQLLTWAGLDGQDLRVVAVAIGPGSFTGLRVGLALAKGMALARYIPIIGIPTLDVLAAAQPICDLQLLAVLHAGRGRLAVGRYQSRSGAWKPDGPIEVLAFDELLGKFTEPLVMCGELSKEQRAQILHDYKKVILASPARSLRRPSFLAELAWRRWRSGKVDDPATLSPIYLHDAGSVPG